ncbi:DUF2188 domain-containing protein [uncultured Algibacter sp.]|uniref:DUF2188 domain-containing protein n=1 Tax=uncultured Algibacter sp. TaxID=298659 RepID=UPI002604A49A|nr:DUF2188 domain-containing protein [uncultured Algibacter sp.]
MTKSNRTSWIQVLKDFIDAYFKSANKKSRTWHQHVVPYEDGWAVRREGNKRISSKHRKQSTAINKAKTIAKRRKANVIIHRASGGIRERINYD